MSQTITVPLCTPAYDRLEALQRAMGERLNLRKVTQAAAVEALLLDANPEHWRDHYKDFLDGLHEAEAQGQAAEPPAEADPDAAPRSVRETAPPQSETVPK